MSYNRWISSPYNLELYHHGVKGMKWGKHLFGKGAEMPQGAGGGGGGNEDDLALLEKLKELYGDKAYEKFLEAKKNRGEAVEFSKLMQDTAKDTRGEDDLHKAVTELLSTRHRQYNEAKAAYERSPKGIVDKVSQKGRDLINKFSKKKPSESKPASKSSKTTTKAKSQVSKEKVIAKGQAVDTDARIRRYGLDVPKRERYRRNGKYRNMNLADVYGPNNKVNDHSGKDGVNLFRQINATDVQNGRNYATRDFDTSKHNDGKYGTRDKIRERITGKADPDNLKSYYRDNVQNFERRANQKQAWSVGMEEEFVRKTAAKETDQYEQRIHDSSLAGLVDRMTPKRRRRW